jgi:DNA-binding transcriptional ArsR family regulator
MWVTPHLYDGGMRADGERTWTFLTNHGHVLVALSRNPTMRIRDLAEAVGITERAAQAILRDLEDAGYVTREKLGRRNQYRLHPERHLRHPAESATPVRDLLGIFERPPAGGEDVSS